MRTWGGLAQPNPPSHTAPLLLLRRGRRAPRYHWGRMMSSTLLSGLLNGLQPATISVVWCQAFDRSKVPSLLLNLRHSHSVNVFFPNTQLLVRLSAGGESGHLSAAKRAVKCC